MSNEDNFDNASSTKPPKTVRISTPAIFQLEVTECSAACLGMILGYYEKFVSIEELRSACNVTRDGSSASNIIEAAISYGLDAKGYTMDLEDVKSIHFPAIIYWSFEHFLVLEGYGENCYYLNDPATGHRTVDESEFDQNFTGIVLEFTPSSTFEKTGEQDSMLSLLRKQLKHVKAPMAFILLCEIALMLPALATAAFAHLFVDRFMIAKDFSWSNGFLISIVFVIVMFSTFHLLQNRIFNYMKAKLSLSMSSNALWRLLRLPIHFFSYRYPGEVAYRMALIDPIVASVTGNLAKSILDVLIIIIFGIAIATYSLPIALVAIVGGVLNLFLMKFTFENRRDDLGKYQASAGKSASYSLSLLESIESIKSMNLENEFFAHWAGYHTKAANVLQDINKKETILGIVPPFITCCTYIALVGIGGWELMQGRMTPGMFLAVQVLLANFLMPIMNLVNFSQSIQFLRVDLKRLDDLLNYPLGHEFAMQQAQPEGASFQKLEGHVDINHVVYGYSSQEPPLLKGIKLEIPAGKSIALVGKTGSGKTTLAMLLAGLLTPWEGEVLYDNVPYDQLPRMRITSSLALVEQTPFLFEGTIRENLSLYNPHVNQEDIVKACKDACIHDDIIERVGGYDLLLKDNGSNMSGGQCQRLEIARGLLKKPSILILDECTSALDPDTEEQIIRNIHRRGCTIIMIAHRLSSIRNCDEIIVIDKGEIVDKGSHEYLKRHSTIYAESVNAESVTI